LCADQTSAVVNALASGMARGLDPNRESVGNLTDYVCGAIDEAEYDRRITAAAQRHQVTPVAAKVAGVAMIAIGWHCCPSGFPERCFRASAPGHRAR
jgi:hypothetical protein